MSATIVPHSKCEIYLASLQSNAIPAYEAADGLISVALLQRPFGGYVEVLMLSLWVSEDSVARFLQCKPEVDGVKTEGAIRVEPHVYEFILSHRGKSRGPDLRQDKESQ